LQPGQKMPFSSTANKCKKYSDVILLQSNDIKH